MSGGSGGGGRGRELTLVAVASVAAAFLLGAGFGAGFAAAVSTAAVFYRNSRQLGDVDDDDDESRRRRSASARRSRGGWRLRWPGRGGSPRGRGRARPLDEPTWRAAQSDDRRVEDWPAVLRRVRRGGVAPALRAELWPYLLEIERPGLTEGQRSRARFARRDAYAHLRAQCRRLRGLSTLLTVASADAAAATAASGVDGDGIDSGGGGSGGPVAGAAARHPAVARFEKIARQIRLDVVRTTPVPPAPPALGWRAALPPDDAALLAEAAGWSEGLSAERRQHSAALAALLEAYARFDPDTGYCQGMNEVGAIMLANADDAAGAFDLFAAAMARLRAHLPRPPAPRPAPDANGAPAAAPSAAPGGLPAALAAVSGILSRTDPRLYHRLREIDCADCFFCVRMIVCALRLELEDEQTMQLWEGLWAIEAADAIAGAARGDAASCAAAADGAWPWRPTRPGRGGADGSQSSSPPPLLLYVVAAVVVGQRRSVLSRSCEGLPEVTQLFNGLKPGRLDVRVVLERAVALRDADAATRGPGSHAGERRALS